MAKVVLDVETFKALASPSRLAVLRSLDERRKTLSELARDLELNKATVHEHLQLLVTTGLVRKRDDEGRKWIYYELSWQGTRLLHPEESTTFAVMLGLSVAAAGGGMALLGRSLGWWWQTHQIQALTEDAPLGPVQDSPGNATADQAPAADGSGDDASSSSPAFSGDAEANGTSAGRGAGGVPEDQHGGGTWWQDLHLDDNGVIVALLLFVTAVLFLAIATKINPYRRK